MDDNFQSGQSAEPAGGSQAQTPPVSPEPAGAISQDSKNLAMLCHLLGLLTNFIGPLILWLIKKDTDAYVEEQGKEALNFQITVLIAAIVSGITAVLCIGAVLGLVVGIADLVLSIMACIAASKGEHYRYPVSIRLIK